MKRAIIVASSRCRADPLEGQLAWPLSTRNKLGETLARVERRLPSSGENSSFESPPTRIDGRFMRVMGV